MLQSGEGGCLFDKTCMPTLQQQHQDFVGRVCRVSCLLGNHASACRPKLLTVAMLRRTAKDLKRAVYECTRYVRILQHPFGETPLDGNEGLGTFAV